jgi:hypothetical protein
MLVSSDRTEISQAQVWNKNDFLAVLGTVTAGGVTIDPSQQMRRTGNITVNSQGLEFDDLVPTNGNSLLHPASGNEIRLFRGFDYDPGNPGTDIEMPPLGVFRMTKPVVDDKGDAITITTALNDRSYLVSRRKWTDAFPLNPGMNLRQAVYTLIQSRVPDLELVYKLALTPGITIPATTFGTDLAGSNDPFADAITLAIAGPDELFFDAEGALVLQPPPTMKPGDVSFADVYVEGEDCTFTDIQKTLDDTLTYNGVVVIGVGSGGAPITAEVWDTDPTSPLYIGANGENKQGFYYQTSLVPSFGQPAAQAYNQLFKMAVAIYKQVHTLLSIPSLTAAPNAALQESDVLFLGRERIDLQGNYVCGQINMPFDYGSQMQVTMRTPVVILPTGTVLQ